MEAIRHLDMDELLALRDGEGSNAARRHVDGCGSCGRELARLYQLRAELRALRSFAPPRDLWARIAVQLRTRRLRRRVGLAVAGLAAAAGLVAVILPRLREGAEAPAGLTRDWVAEARSEDLGPYIARTVQLESLLRTYPPTYRVYDAPTALAVSALEDRIVILDHMLQEGRQGGANRELLVGLWDERVAALETLVGLELGAPGGVWR
jgi:hypothetical protein